MEEHVTKFSKRKTKILKGRSIDTNLPNSYRSILETTLEEHATPGKTLFFICDT